VLARTAVVYALFSVFILCSCSERRSVRRGRVEDEKTQAIEAAKVELLKRHPSAVDFNAGRGTLHPRLTVDLQEMGERGTLFWTEFYAFDVVKSGAALQLHVGIDGGSRWLVLDCTADHLQFLRSARRPNAARARMLAFFSIRDAAPMRFQVGAEINVDGEFSSAYAAVEFFDGVACRGRLIDVAMIGEPTPL